MSSSAAAASAAPSTIYLGLDVHKESITIAVLPVGAPAPTRVERLSGDLLKVRRYLERLTRDGSVLRACYEASGAGYVLQRAMREWGHACDVIAPSLIPKKPGVQRKHDKRDAVDLARLSPAGELTAVRIPSEAEERVRDVVRCRETFQRELVKSRHYILKCLARRGFVYRDGTNWSKPHLAWLRWLAAPSSPLAPEDQLVFGEYLALGEYLAHFDYKLQRRDELDARIEVLRCHRRINRTRNDARANLFDYIERIYNLTRRHSALGNESPVNCERNAGVAQLATFGPTSIAIGSTRQPCGA